MADTSEHTTVSPQQVLRAAARRESNRANFTTLNAILADHFSPSHSSAKKGIRGLTTYDVLDRVADSVNPTLALLALSLPWLRAYRSRSPSPWLRVSATLLCVGVAYAGHAFDTLTGTWPAYSLDYSGHTAVCVALLASLGHLGRPWMLASIAIGSAYAALMMYQGYHTLADILTTAIPIGLVCVAVWRSMPAIAHSGISSATRVDNE